MKEKNGFYFGGTLFYYKFVTENWFETYKTYC